jgi:hypothetical protein
MTYKVNPATTMRVGLILLALGFAWGLWKGKR